jgi:hypothetical protein
MLVKAMARFAHRLGAHETGNESVAKPILVDAEVTSR